MAPYIVMEISTKNNYVLDSWVCSTKEEAAECLRERYKAACAYNFCCGMPAPVDCLDNGFFTRRLTNGIELTYCIEQSQYYKKNKL